MRWEKFSMQVRENFNMAKSIMIQGTMSNVGKSLLAGGLCRVLKEDGIKVAPFKSQNMSLNSFITADGLEIFHRRHDSRNFSVYNYLTSYIGGRF